jgi:hypothetical protein
MNNFERSKFLVTSSHNYGSGRILSSFDLNSERKAMGSAPNHERISWQRVKSAPINGFLTSLNRLEMLPGRSHQVVSYQQQVTGT